MAGRSNAGGQQRFTRCRFRLAARYSSTVNMRDGNSELMRELPNVAVTESFCTLFQRKLRNKNIAIITPTKFQSKCPGKLPCSSNLGLGEIPCSSNLGLGRTFYLCGPCV